MKPLDFSRELNRLMDPYWRKARIAARLLLKREAGQPWSPLMGICVAAGDSFENSGEGRNRMAEQR